jgi:hypothetical protein
VFFTNTELAKKLNLNIIKVSLAYKVVIKSEGEGINLIDSRNINASAVGNKVSCSGMNIRYALNLFAVYVDRELRRCGNA